jgi:hypothetical protein
MARVFGNLTLIGIGLDPMTLKKSVVRWEQVDPLRLPDSLFE